MKGFKKKKKKKTNTFLSHSVNGAVTHPNEKHVDSKIQRSPQVLCLLLGCRRGRMQQLILQFKGNILTCSTSLNS